VSNPGVITDTNDLEARGFEAELTVNPSPRWRITFNAASQETILTNVAPRLTQVLDQTWLPHLANFGDLDWNEPAGVVNGPTLAQQVNDRLQEYFAIKGQEGRPQQEQRRWRLNLVGRHAFGDGRLRGLSVGGALRWEDSYAAGYPLRVDARGVIQPDLKNPWLAPPQTSADLFLGYQRRLPGSRNWTLQLNVRNLQNLLSDKVSAVRYQPDGGVARVRFDPPLQVYLTNTLRL
jgi:outer membrane receptor for ferric coprogen and ferric-rhodotorulic acid